MTYGEIISKVQNCSVSRDEELDLFIDTIAETVEGLNLSSVPRERLLEQLLLSLERQPNAELTLWSFIHFIEGLDQDNTTNYLTQLKKSLERRPTLLTLLLTNRILNSLPDESADRVLFLTALKEIASNSSLDENVRIEASEFYEYQLNKKTES
jgi:hypothetical protein